MKKLLTVTALLALSTTAFANFNDNGQNNGGFAGQVQQMTVAQALKAKDNSYVSIEGTIAKRLGDDDYLFQDNTGTIKAEIDDDVWRNQTVNPTDKVRIYGEIDNERFEKTTIDVKQLQKLN
ncbi:NirD/YgiW/YdeI family stress tolerance protein [Conservatibacter flavescens]|uniref:TIGR00156 family protein n=1 Tax=Conservatibacter flavescens TaxID=28161 RepID=A0A2M8S4B4_9PAST|nr:NirD/YgiW/YdeI family stress tolerance protein [Conservatibacter flavescens]PJG85989.1 TIGR00156 family protein [Conservatibacter flavescens]